MIGIVDYGMGNLGSVSNACRYLGLPHRVIAEPGELRSCSALILPGVGAFGDCMIHLSRAGFVEPLKKWLNEGRPYLGICLGLQVLFESSEESPGIPGLGVLPGAVRRFDPAPDRKVPQIGWNRVKQMRADCPLFREIPDGTHFYFVHSFYVPRTGAAYEAGITEYGVSYTSVLWQGKWMAVQFHPEKSQRLGLRVLRNFAVEAGLA